MNRAIHQQTPWSIKSNSPPILKIRRRESRPCLLATELGVQHCRTPILEDIALLRERGFLLMRTKAVAWYTASQSWGVGVLTPKKKKKNQKKVFWGNWFVAQPRHLQRVWNSHLFMTSLIVNQAQLMASFSAQQKEQLRTLRQRISLGLNLRHLTC